MDTTGTGEPVEEIMQAVQDRSPGFDIDKFQRGPFKQYRDGGLIPRPIQRPGRGKSHGKGAIYPDSTTTQLLRILDMRDEPERFNVDRALWRLWWEGWTVDLDRVKRLLIAKQESWEQELRAFGKQWRKNDLEALKPFTDHRQPLPILGQARRRTGPDRFGTFAYLILGIMNGDYAKNQDVRWFHNDSENDEDIDIIRDALGVSTGIGDLTNRERKKFASEIGDSLVRFSDAVSPDALRACIDDANEAELLIARDELKTVVGAVRNLSWIVDPFIGQTTAGHDLLNIPAKEATELAQGAMLIWLSLRHRPGWNQLGTVLTDLSVLTNLHDQIHEWQVTAAP